MSLWSVFAVVLILGLVTFSASNTFVKARASRQLMANEHPYTKESTDYTKTVLVLGDSTAVGIGADKPEDSVAGRVAAYVEATYVENHAISGTAVEDLPKQINEAKREFYDLILIQVGGNDILSFSDPKKVGPLLTEVLKTLPKAGKVVVFSAGNVGGASIFPHPIRPIHTWLTLEFHKAFAKAVEGLAIYVNLYEPPGKDLFLKDQDRYLSVDGLHPSSEGYRLWFEKVREVL
ncbi:MAG: hypothetical protein KBD05_00685 [Candidatus Pacebacteria bacterium]|nr:hypothetical protein [Candidatus Paceibacterota bacterium]